jgi:long-chain acyl-CoA synthetase
LASSLINNKLIYEEAAEGLQLVGVYSRNRQEFYLSDLACVLYGITCVPLYDTLGIDNLSYCLAHSNISTCICSMSNARILLGLGDTANLRNLILCDPLEPSFEEELRKKFNVFYFWQLVDSVKLEEILDYSQFSVEPDQCFTFSYTSGTTGPPKGAMLSQKNFLAFIAGLKIALTNLDRNSED